VVRGTVLLLKVSFCVFYFSYFLFDFIVFVHSMKSKPRRPSCAISHTRSARRCPPPRWVWTTCWSSSPPIRI
jgi:hypothetical protein